jgi:cyclopropane-fatty-acyl-phospholipid synthase
MASPLTEFKLVDYRDMQGETFERIVSVGMMEHVGYKNYKTYIKKIHQLLAQDGLCLLHTIGDTVTNYSSDPWMDKYIFPNGMLPSVKHVAQSIIEPTVLEDWHNFGANYDKTLMAWHENFVKAWPELKASGKYDDRFYRMWEYYLLIMAASFRTRKGPQLWQMVFSKRGIPGGYKSVR